MRRRKERNYFDYSLLCIIIFLLCFGLVMLYSTTSYKAQMQSTDPTEYLSGHILGIILGFTMMLIISKIDYHMFAGKMSWLAYFMSIVLILLVLSPLGKSSKGATRWILIGSLTFQPAEFAKVAVILLMAQLITKCSRSIKKISVIIKLLLVVAPIVLLIKVVTNNLSSAIIIAGIAVVMIFVATPRYNIFLIGGTAVAGLVAFIVYKIDWLVEIVGGFRLERVLAWLHPEDYAQGTGFQVLQSLYAIGRGGIFGKGLGNSIQKLDFLPEAQNDMIFAVICEELGLFGAICVILMFIFMLWRFTVIANNAPDLFGSMIVVGIMAHIAIQVILNIAVVTNSMPNTGITLPFISYGGTSIMVLLAEMGLALGVSRQIKIQR